MKKLILSLIAFTTFSVGFAQTRRAYYDAVKLRKYVSVSGTFASNPDDKYIDILYKYAPKDIQSGSVGDLKKYYKNENPFFEDYILSTTGSSLLGSRTMDTDRGSGIGTFAKNIAGLDATVFADALAKFMIERAQAELTVAFFDRFQDFIEKHPDVEKLFPKTTARLEKIHAIHYRQMLNVLRVAFQEDLDALPDNLIDVVEDIAERKSIPELKLVAKTIKQVRKLEYMSAVEFINQLPMITADHETVNKQWYSNLDASLKLTAIFSNSLADTTDDRNWVSSSVFYDSIARDEITRNIFIGLVYQQIKTDGIKINKTELSTMIGDSKEEIDWFNEQFSKLITFSEQVDEAVNEISEAQKSGDDVSHAQVHSYISTAIEITEFGYDIFSHFAEKNGVVEGDFTEYLGMFRSANEVYRYAYEKEYGSAVLEVANLLEDIYDRVAEERNGNLEKVLDAIKDNADLIGMDGAGNKARLNQKDKLTDDQNTLLSQVISTVNADHGGGDLSKNLAKRLIIDLIKSELKEYKNDDHEWLNNLATFGVFMANMVEAESDSVAMEILNAAALPVGSSTLRKNSEFSVNLTSYLGGADDLNSKSVALYAPVGVDFGWGFGKGGSLSVNASILDVGAIVDYRLANDSSAIESKITLGNILSPGASLVYGFPYSIPIAAGVGAQYGPGLTSIAEDNTAVINSPGWKFRFFVAVDMPLFNFYNKPRKKL